MTNVSTDIHSKLKIVQVYGWLLKDAQIYKNKLPIY